MTAQRRFPAFLLLILLLFPITAGWAEDSGNRLEIRFIDVGMGDAILLRCYSDGAAEDMMIDTGDRDHAAFVAAYMRDMSVTELRSLVLTHPHADHIGGASGILDSFAVDQIVLPPIETDTATYGKLMDKIEMLSVPLLYPQIGDTLRFSAAQLTLLAPAPVLYQAENDWSLVYMLDYAGRKVLFMGDAEAASEEDMMLAWEDLHADVLKVGHHGSATSTSYDFAQAVSPAYAIIS